MENLEEDIDLEAGVDDPMMSPQPMVLRGVTEQGQSWAEIQFGSDF